MPKVSSIDFENEVEIYKLRKNLFNIKQFSCKNQAYADYIKKDAFEDQVKSIGQTWVFVYKQKEVIGYTTIAMAELNKSHHKKLSGFPHSHVPSLLLGRLATHQDYEGLGVGTRMTHWVISEGKRYSKELGCRLVILNPEKDVIEWYRDKLGFMHIPIKKKQGIMFYDLG